MVGEGGCLARRLAGAARRPLTSCKARHSGTNEPWGHGAGVGAGAGPGREELPRPLCD